MLKEIYMGLTQFCICDDSVPVSEFYMKSLRKTKATMAVNKDGKLLN